jgi:hypothetical protein
MCQHPATQTVTILRYLSICLLLVLLATSQCASANEDPFCSRVQTQGDSLAGRVAAMSAGMVTAGKAVLLRGLVDNPTAICSGGNCVVNAGVAGVEVRQAGPWVCVGVPGKGKLGTTFGWLPAERWHSYSGVSEPVARWVGVWQNEVAKISVQQVAAGQLYIEGHALWVGGALNQPHFGEFEITAAPNNGVVLTTSDVDTCQVAVRLVGDFLVAADNGGCGGMNVRFDGMYRFRHR